MTTSATVPDSPNECHVAAAMLYRPELLNGRRGCGDDDMRYSA